MTERGDKPAGWHLERQGPEAYEQYLVPSMFAPWAERLVDEVNLEESDRVLDVGCGTGIVARRVADRLGDRGTVFGLDINEGMLAVAETTIVEPRPAIEWRHGDATDLPFSAESFDVVFCQQMIQFVTAPSDSFREMRRALNPDGQVVASVWRPLEYNPGYVELANVLERHVGDDAGSMMRSPFPRWSGDEFRSMARNAGFDDPSVTIEIGSMRYPSVEEFVRREAASSPLAESFESIGREIREADVREVGDALEEYVDDEGVVFPMESFVLTGRR